MQLMLITAAFFLFLNGYTNAEAYYTTSTGGVGAAYTMSNGVPNQILVHRVAANGKIAFVRAVNTGGNGVNVTDVDPLGSQAPVVVYKNYLFAVNAGSNTLSMFVICPWDATQIKLLPVKPTKGTFPISVTVNDKYACVLTGGNVTGVRCFTYNSAGLSVVSSLDRDTTSFVSQTIPPGVFTSFSQILFSADNRALIITTTTSTENGTGYLLSFLFNSARTQLSSKPIRATLPSSRFPVGFRAVGKTGLIVTDGEKGVSTMTYSSSSGRVSNYKYTQIHASIDACLCWVVYSPTLGSYYVSAPGISTITELRVNLQSTSKPVQIVKNYLLSNDTGVLEQKLVTLSGKDYLYVIGTAAHVISGFQLKAVGQATPYTRAVSQRGNTSTIPKLAGLAAFVQTRSSYNQYSRCRPAKSCFAKRDSYFDCY